MNRMNMSSADASSTRRYSLALWVAVPTVLTLAPTVGLIGPVGMRHIVFVGLISLIVSGLNLSWGYAGELNLGQAAMYAAGAYAAGYSAIHWQNDLLLNLLIAGVAALMIGVIGGVPGLRLGGWALAIVSFFLVILIPDVLNIFGDTLGGFNGLIGIPRAQLFGVEVTDYALYVAVVIVTVGWLIIFRNLVKSNQGSAFLVLRESPILARSLGISVYGMKLKAYALGAVPAGLAGCFFAYLDGFINPTTFGFELTILVLASAILGGSESVLGALLGAGLLVSAEREFQGLQDYTTVLYGLLLVIGGAFLSRGLSGLFDDLTRRWIGSAGKSSVGREGGAADYDFPELRGQLLVATDITKRFGGVTALNRAALAAKPGEITALIGPNGSGKTTLLNVMCGYYKADEGEVRLGKTLISGLQPHVVARKGVARTFQTPTVPSTLTAAEVVETGTYSKSTVSTLATVLKLPSATAGTRANQERVHELLEALGISHLAGETASHLSLGTRRLIELARALASQPAVLLLDEVASGLDEDELADLATVIRAIRRAGATIVLVEHNFSLVRELADTIYALAEGSVIASGTPHEIADHPEVLRKYLGEPVATMPPAGGEAGEVDLDATRP